ncbi:MAG: MerR family transcriptional regulator [Verrucomicrobiota bacterium]
MNNGFSIGEFSKITGLSTKTLRFYHEKNLLPPASVDRVNGYRFYSPANLARARIIIALKALDFSLSDIGEMLSTCDDDGDILHDLERHRKRIIEDIKQRRAIVTTLETIIQQEKESRRIMKQSTYCIEEKSVPATLVAGIRMKGRYEESEDVFGQLGKKAEQFIRGNAMCLYYDGEYREEDADFEPCFPVSKAVDRDGISSRELPEARCVTLLHKGPYEALGRSYEQVLTYLKENGLTVVTPTREVYIKGPGMVFDGNPENYLTEIQIPVE